MKPSRKSSINKFLHFAPAFRCFVVVVLIGIAIATDSSAETPPTAEPVALRSSITHVQPMTGIVLWTTNDKVDTDAIQLEFRYCGYNEVVDAAGNYDFSKIDQILDEVAARKHQAVLRFYFVYVGKQTTVPDSIKRRSDYRETVAKSEGNDTHFCDWSNQALQQFTLEFYTKLAERYDNDPRLAFLETGFGLWAEYHIYDGPRELGKHFPDKAFQAKFLKHMQASFKTLPWMVSIDISDSSYAPVDGNAQLLDLNFGVFDDSFLCKQHVEENEQDWIKLSLDRWKRAPGGGEFSYYNQRDQKMALSPNGPNGVSFEEAAKQFHISFMIGNDQTRYQSLARIAEAGLATGYRFQITSAERTGTRLRLEVTNTGVAPIYRDAYFAIDDQRAEQTLKGLLPGDTIAVELDDPQASASRALRVDCDHLVPGQEIQYEADLQ